DTPSCASPPLFRPRRAEVVTRGTASGDERFIEEMRFRLGCFAEADGLTPVGWTGTVNDIASRLENRLRIRKPHARHPEIADEPNATPLVVGAMHAPGTP